MAVNWIPAGNATALPLTIAASGIVSVNGLGVSNTNYVLLDSVAYQR